MPELFAHLSLFNFAVFALLYSHCSLDPLVLLAVSTKQRKQEVVVVVEIRIVVVAVIVPGCEKAPPCIMFLLIRLSQRNLQH